MHVAVSVCVFDDERVCVWVCENMCVSVVVLVLLCVRVGAVLCVRVLCYKVEESGHSVLFNIGLVQSQARFFSNPSHT